MPRLTDRICLAAELRVKHPNKRYSELARMIGLKNRTSFGWRITQYRKATGQYRPRSRRFRFRLVRPAQLPLFE